MVPNDWASFDTETTGVMNHLERVRWELERSIPHCRIADRAAQTAYQLGWRGANPAVIMRRNDRGG
jgi:hypothetical protein